MATMEEKAKRYVRALKVAKDIKNGKATYIPDGTPVIEALFPELAESEDEKIRKSLIILLQHFCKGYRVSGLDFPVSYKDMLAWLEKQSENDSNKTPIVWKHWKDGICGNGEGKPIYLIKNGDAYSISPVLGFECDYIELSDLDKLISAKDTLKFKVGDWVVNKYGDVWHIDSYDKKNYQVSDGKGKYNYFPIDKQDEMHLWTIQDTKDGDVLINAEGKPFIFKGLLDAKHPNCPVAYGGVCINCYDVEEFCISKRCHWWCDLIGVKPAAKEQRDALMKAMADAGYTFDFEKKELKEIVNKEQIKENLQDNSFRRMFEQKPSWGKEDEKIYNRICSIVHDAAFANYDVDEVGEECGEYAKITGWLKSLKQKMGGEPSTN